jgi:hypothetical protein
VPIHWRAEPQSLLPPEKHLSLLLMGIPGSRQFIVALPKSPPTLELNPDTVIGA